MITNRIIFYYKKSVKLNCHRESESAPSKSDKSEKTRKRERESLHKQRKIRNKTKWIAECDESQPKTIQ